MISLITCELCGRKVSAEAVKSAGGKSVCPPCFEKAKQIVEEKRRKAAEEKKTAVSKSKIEAAKAKAVSRLAERGIAVEDVIDRPVILPPSDVIPAATAKKRSRAGEDDLGKMLSSAGAVCLAARIASVVMLVMAGLALIGGVLGALGAAGEAGGVAALGVVGMVAVAVVSAACMALPALLLWFLGGWVKRFSALFARHLEAESSAL